MEFRNLSMGIGNCEGPSNWKDGFSVFAVSFSFFVSRIMDAWEGNYSILVEIA